MYLDLSLFIAISLLSCLGFPFASSKLATKTNDEFSFIAKVTKDRAPFFEMPCMHVNGICSKGFACPPDTKVLQLGLCPVQQHLGIECCKPFHVEKKCSAKDGTCMPKTFKCPNLVTTGIEDCSVSEICCLQPGEPPLQD